MYKISKENLEMLLTHKTQNNKFVADVDAINNTVFLDSMNAFLNAGKPDFASLAFTDKFDYQYIVVESGKVVKGIESITIKTKSLKCADVFALKTNKKSYKVALPNDLKTLLDCCCGNLAKNYMTSRDNIEAVKIYADFDKSLNCFVSDEKTGRDASSKTQLEKQINRLFTMFFGENVVTARKGKTNGNNTDDVQMLIDAQTKAILKKDKSGFVTSGELVLLDNLMILAYECKHNRVYTHKGKYASGKAPKTK